MRPGCVFACVLSIGFFSVETYAQALRRGRALRSPAPGFSTQSTGLSADVTGAVAGRALLIVREFQQGDLNGDGDTSDRVLHVLDLKDGTSTNLGLELGGYTSQFSNRFVFSVSESSGGRDLNADGDATDDVLHVLDLVSGELVNIGYASPFGRLRGDLLAFTVWEPHQGTDLNLDGDTQDELLLIRDLSTGTDVFLGPVNRTGTGQTPLGLGFQMSEEFVLFAFSEAQGGVDQNGDGDTQDSVGHVYDFATRSSESLRIAGFETHFTFSYHHSGRVFVPVTEGSHGADLNGDGDLEDDVLHVYDHAARTFRNLGIQEIRPPLAANEDWILFRDHENLVGKDANGDGDTLDTTIYVFDEPTGTVVDLGLMPQSPGESTYPGYLPHLFGNWLAVQLEEPGVDLNRDGDTTDEVMLLHDLAGGSVEAEVLGALDRYGDPTRSSEDLVAFALGETEQGGTDLDDDGTVSDGVLHVYLAQTAETINTKLPVAPITFRCGHHFTCWESFYRAHGTTVTLGVPERHRMDLNGDGDTDDHVIHVIDLAPERAVGGRITNTRVAWHPAQIARTVTPFEDWVAFRFFEEKNRRDLNGDGDLLDFFQQLHHVPSGETIDLGLSGDNIERLTDRIFAFDALEYYEERDLNGDGDTNDSVLHLVTLDSP